MAQLVKHLPLKCEGTSSDSQNTYNRKKTHAYNPMVIWETGRSLEFRGQVAGTKLQANETLCLKQKKYEKVAKNQHWRLSSDFHMYAYTPRQACTNTHTPKHACRNMCECVYLPLPSLLHKNVKISV